MNARFLLALTLVLGSLLGSTPARADQPAPTPQTQTAPAPAPTQLAWQRVGAPASLEA
jgi:hypothetical protein